MGFKLRSGNKPRFKDIGSTTAFPKTEANLDLGEKLNLKDKLNIEKPKIDIKKSKPTPKPKPKPKAKPRRASTKTTVVNGVTRIRKVHKAPKQNVASWHSKLSSLDRERMLAIKAQNERLANQ